MSSHRLRIPVLPAVLAAGGMAFGHGNHEIKLEAWNRKLVPGHAHANQYQHRVRVWSTAFGADFGLEDGYHMLPAGTRVRLDLLDAARAWDGSDFERPIALGAAVAMGDEALFALDLPPALAGQELHVQAVELATGRVSAWTSLRL